MGIIYLNKVYAEALNVANLNLKDYSDGNQLLSCLRKQDVTEIKSSTIGFVRVLSNIYKDSYAICLCKTILETPSKNDYTEEQDEVMSQVIDPDTGKLSNTIKACAIMDGTVVVWQCEEKSKLGFADQYALEVGKVKGISEMMQTPNWAVC